MNEKKINVDALIKNMREPKLRDIRAVNSIESLEDREVVLISSLAGISEEELNEITYADYQKLAAKLSSFIFPGGQNVNKA